jgi:hypothetical protein
MNHDKGKVGKLSYKNLELPLFFVFMHLRGFVFHCIVP